MSDLLDVSGFAASLVPSSLVGVFGSADWTANLLPASFRGVPFQVESHEEQGGRRPVQYEFPGRDTPSSTDLGRKGGVYHIQAFVVGDDYMAQRDALRQAVQNLGTVGTLSHPYLGQLLVRSGAMRLREQIAPGRIATFDLEFFEDGQQPSPISRNDTSSALLSGIASALPVLAEAYSYGVLIAQDPAALGQLVSSELEGFGTAFLGALGLPAGIISSLVNLSQGLGASPAQTSTTATAVTTLTTAAAGLVITQSVPAPVVDDPVAGIPTVPEAPADASLGLAAMAAWAPDDIGTAISAGTIPAAIALPQLQAPAAATRAAVQALVQGACVCAVAQVYASVDWPNQAAAQTAADQLSTLIEAQLDAASEAENDDLAMAWRGIFLLASADFNARAQALPAVAPYALRGVLPALRMAQTFYQDGTRADEIASLNGVWHAGWMPIAGVALAA